MITAIDQNTALVLIDLQKGILKSVPEATLKPVLENAAALVSAFRKEKLPVVIVTHTMVGALLPGLRKENSPAQTGLSPVVPAIFSEVVDEIGNAPEDILILKNSWNAFSNTRLHEELQKHAITNIVLAGVATSIGVEGAARAASERGINITFATDAMADRFAESHHHSLTYIFPRIGELGTTEEVIAMLAKRMQL